MKEVLHTLFDQRTLSRVSAKEALLNIASSSQHDAQIAAFMSVYLMRSISVDELAGFRDAMLELSIDPQLETNEVLDIVGTGGDGKNTFNISTLTSFVVAGTGIKVAKHGNYGVSSISGSSNVLEAIGYKFSNDTAVLNEQLEKCNLCFLHAPLFHPAMKRVSGLRKDLGVRTFFNMLGPIVNPANPKYKFLGTYDLEMGRIYNYLLQKTGSVFSIVNSFDGYDEISLTANFKILTGKGERIFRPADLGFGLLKQSDLYGGASVENSAKLFMDVLKNTGTMAQKSVVIANAAFAIQCVKSEVSISDSIAMAKDSLESKKALEVYNKLISICS